ncbi:MAG: YceI family protein [Pseudomonadota bacterium]
MTLARRLTLLLIALIAPLLLAANTPSQALNYTIDVAASDVSAKVPFFGIASKTARFPKMEGAVTIVPDQPQAARIDVTFDATALEAPDSVTLSRLKGEKFFWVEKYPEVRFVGDTLELTSATKGTVTGQLTARGVTQPATLKVEFDKDPLTAPRDQAISFTGKTTIDRRKYGMKSYQLIVGNKVKITLSAKMLPKAEVPT